MIVPQLRVDFCKNVEYPYNGMPRCGVSGNLGPARRSGRAPLHRTRSLEIIRLAVAGYEASGDDAAMF